jgi:predicted PurR-regulated permease PerM
LAALMFLRTAHALLIPIVIAVLMSYALEPLVVRLQRARIPRVIGAALLLLPLVGGAAWGAYALREEIREALKALPEATRRASEWLGVGELSRQEAVPSAAVVQQGIGWVISGVGHPHSSGVPRVLPLDLWRPLQAAIS